MAHRESVKGRGEGRQSVDGLFWQLGAGGGERSGRKSLNLPVVRRPRKEKWLDTQKNNGGGWMEYVDSRGISLSNETQDPRRRVAEGSTSPGQLPQDPCHL